MCSACKLSFTSASVLLFSILMSCALIFVMAHVDFMKPICIRGTLNGFVGKIFNLLRPIAIHQALKEEVVVLGF